MVPASISDRIHLVICERFQNLTELNTVVPSTASSSNKLATMADLDGEYVAITTTASLTWGQALTAMANAIDSSKITLRSKLVANGYIFRIENISRHRYSLSVGMSQGNYLWLSNLSTCTMLQFSGSAQSDITTRTLSSDGMQGEWRLYY